MFGMCPLTQRTITTSCRISEKHLSFKRSKAAKAAAAARVKQPYSGYSSEEEEELSLEEQQAMEMENERLVEQLSSLTSQVID